MPPLQASFSGGRPHDFWPKEKTLVHKVLALPLLEALIILLAVLHLTRPLILLFYYPEYGGQEGFFEHWNRSLIFASIFAALFSSVAVSVTAKRIATGLGFLLIGVTLAFLLRFPHGPNIGGGFIFFYWRNFDHRGSILDFSLCEHWNLPQEVSSIFPLGTAPVPRSPSA